MKPNVSHLSESSHFYFGSGLSSLMTTSPALKKSQTNLKRANSSAGFRINTGNIKLRAARIQTDKGESKPKIFLTDGAIQSPSNDNKTLSTVLMTPRRDVTEGRNESTERVMLHLEDSTTSRDFTVQKASEFNYKEDIRRRILENEWQRHEISRLESELRTCKRNLKNSISEDTVSSGQLSDKELKEILQTLNLLLSRAEESYNSITKKCNRLDELINYISSGSLSSYKGLELRSFTDRLKKISGEFKQSAYLETEVGIKSRELVKKKLEYSNLSSRYHKLSVKSDGLQHDLDVLRESLKAGNVERNIYVRGLTKEKGINRENQKKLGDLQKTLQIITEGGNDPFPIRHSPMEFDTVASNNNTITRDSNLTKINDTAVFQKPEDKESNNIARLREALTKLVKENESLRRVIHSKDREIEKLNDDLARTSFKLNKAVLRVERLRNPQNAQKLNDGTQDEEELLVFYSNKRSMEVTKPASSAYLDVYKTLPKNLDFRFGLFEEKYVDLINDVLEGGSQAFAEHIRMLSSDEEIKEEVTLIANQFISYRNFSEKLNRLMIECFNLLSLKTFDEVMIHVNMPALKQILAAGTVRVWIHEPLTGTYRTMEKGNKVVKCLVSKGLIADVISKSSRILKRSKNQVYDILENLSNDDGSSTTEKGSTCLLMPLKGEDEKVIGVLEISNFSYETFLMDLDYFGQILCEFCAVLWDRTNREDVLRNDIKYKEMYLDAFAELSSASSHKEFCLGVEEWAPRVFPSSIARYVLVNNSLELTRFFKNKSPQILDVNNGIIGKVTLQRKPFILLDVMSSKIHSDNIDINTTFPLYTVPVLIKRKSDGEISVIGVLQIVLNQKSTMKEKGSDDLILNYIKTLDSNLENLISKFTKLVAIAFETMEQRQIKE